MYLNAFIFLILCLSNSGAALSVDVNEIIESIPPNDRCDLEELFYSLVDDEAFGYTLFGDKPVSFGGYFKVTPWENYIELGQCHGLFWKKWEIWEKYKNQFDIHNFLLLKEAASSLSDRIILINKNTLIKTIENNLETFESILREKIDPAQFVSKIESGQISFFDSIQNNEMLLGICLDYGKRNARLFCQRGKIFKEDSMKPCGDYKRSLLRIQSIYFMADHDHAETQYLKEKYGRLRGIVSAIYAKGNFLQTTLSKLTAE